MAKKKTNKRPDSVKKRQPPGADSRSDGAPDNLARANVPVVGMGASAGGLDAFKKFFAVMPPDSGIAFVLIPHLDPHHDSLMVELLQKHTAMPVAEAAEGVRVEADHVYVIPPNQYLAIRGGRLTLTGPVERYGPPTAIDYFFDSLAEDCGEWAIGVILSGTASHGVHGLKNIKSHGGIAMVQEPSTAQYASMPQSAIATGLVDRVLPVEKMPGALIRCAQQPHSRTGRPAPVPALEHVSGDLQQIVAFLQIRNKYDFRCYRKPMLLRRIERRMRLSCVETISQYVTFLRDHPEEAQLLTRDLLISVTQFFRDPEAFQALECDFLPEFVRRHPPEAPVRVWVPACATGEEAYSLAIVVLEQLAAAGKTCRVQVFATDVDEEALAVARHGLYPESIAVDVSPERLQRFFTLTNEHSYVVNKTLRQVVVFAPQNVLSDPPFSRMDLVACRNLIIYLEPEIQQRLVTLFHFSLNDRGCLFLGPSETIGRQTDLYEPVSKKWRLFRRIGPTRPERINYPVIEKIPHAARGTQPEPIVPASISVAHLTEQILLAEHTPAAVLITRAGHILYFNGPTGRFLEQPGGEPTRDLFRLVRDGLPSKLRTTVQRAIREDKAVTVGDARVRGGKSSLLARVTVKPVPVAGLLEGLLLVIFEELGQPAAPAGESRDPADESQVSQLKAELKATREDLQYTIKESESSNEEMKAANEEAMSMNEELQSANEELESSKEELQSLNEELATVNSELREKVEMLEIVNNDIANLLDSTDIAMVFLDLKRRIRRFTPAATRLVRFQAGDVGRSIDDLTHEFVNDELQGDIERALGDGGPVEKEVATSAGAWYIRRVLPYRTLTKRVDGVVVSLSDVTHLKQAERERKLLERKVLDMADEERRRIGQDLHDVTGQELTGLGLMADSLIDALSEQSSPEIELATAIHNGVKRVLGQVRIMSRGLVPVEIDAGGLMSALTDLAELVADRFRVDCRFACDEPVPVADNTTATNLYRIAQEAVTNAVKHGHADKIIISLTIEAGHLRLGVQDNGVGIQSPSSPDAGIGLRIMRYRAGLINCTFGIEPVENGGTLVTCLEND